MSCRVALLKLERQSQIQLPLAGARPAGKRKTGQAEIRGKAPQPVKCSLTDLGVVELVRVGHRGGALSREWNELMDRDHYLGSGPLCGAQMRYLIRSSQKGWLGGLAFSSAAWRLEARDRWIGWQEPARRENLQKVVCNSRFLICPQVKVVNLASHVLGMSVRRVREDWKERYGVEPLLLETFVEKDLFKGSSYRAANWVRVGESRGRGRQDGHNQWALAVKEIYVYPLGVEARKKLCKSEAESIRQEREHQEILEKPSPRTERSWPAEEFADAALGHERLRKRLLILAEDFYAQPQASVPQACRSRAKTKAAYRFFDHENTTMEKILEPHYRATEERLKKEPVVLAVQDTTSVNYSSHPATVGLGAINSKAHSMGLEVHDTLVFNVEGTPLGLLDVQSWARKPKEKDYRKKNRRRQLPIEQKESYKWLKSFQAVAKVQKRCPETTLVSVGDRESDIYELFVMAFKEKSGPKLLVRAEHARQLAEEQGPVWDYLAGEPRRGTQTLFVPRQKNRPAREAKLEVRFMPVRLKPPRDKSKLPELNIWAILAEEKDAPKGATPLKWMLLTTLEVRSFKQATEKLAWYAKRWGIELYHKTIKSGCRIEERLLAHAERIEACLAIDMVVAWRIFFLTKLGRETPDVPCTVFFKEFEWKALVAHVQKDPVPPSQPPTLNKAVRMVASLGGFLGRKGDGEPGTKSMWLGLQCLDGVAAMWKFMAITYAPQLLSPAVSSNPGYG